MTSQTKAVLKSYFNTGDIPTEAQFSDMFDSFPPTNTNLVVAAVDAPQRVIDYADYVCDGVNDEVQIQAAIDAIPAGGGKISFSAGTFVLSWAGEIDQDVLVSPYCVKITETHPPVSLEGVPGATIIKLEDGQPIDSCQILIRGSVASHRTDPVFISGIEFDGNQANQTGTWTNFGCVAQGDADSVTITNCRFKNWSRNGFHVAWTSQKAIVTDSYFYGQGSIRLEAHNYLVSGNIFEDPNTTEFVPGGANVQIICDADRLLTSRMCSIVGNTFIGGIWPLFLNGSQACLVFGNTFCNQSDVNAFAIGLSHYDGGVGSRYDCKNNIIIGNTIYNCVNGIRISGNGTTLNAHQNIIAYNQIMDGPDTNMAYGILEGWSTNAKNLIEGNVFSESGISTKIEATGVGTIVRGNVNYVTENDGAASTADGGTIAHGCAATPTVATVSGSVAGEIVTVTAISSTTITVAIKKNDGSAGTTQTVYWRAEV